MNPTLIYYFIIPLFVFALFALCLWPIFDTFRHRKEILAKLERQEEERCSVEFTAQEVRASVIDVNCAVQTVGLKSPKTETVFTVVFQTEQEEVLSFQVPEEMYEGLEVGQAGLLTIVDGQLYGFAPDEAEE